MQDKHALRQEIRTQRQTLSPKFRQDAAQKVAQHLLQFTPLQQATTVALYHAINGEVDLQATIQVLATQNKTCLLPALTHDRRLTFHIFSLGDELSNNRYRIPEPDTSSPQIPAQDIDLVLMPLLGFDAQGNRLGQGAGFYDRTFAFTQHHQTDKPCLVGVAYEFQKMSQLAVNPWDIPVHFVVTEKHIYHCQG